MHGTAVDRNRNLLGAVNFNSPFAPLTAIV
jgi:hypothetical protein